MNFLALSSLINFAAACGLAVIVWRKCPQRPVAHAYTIFNFSLAFYSFYYFLWQLAKDPAKAMLYHQLLFLGVIWIQQALLYFVFCFLDIAEEKKVLLWTAALINLGFSVLNMNGGLYPGVEPRFGIGFWPILTRWAIVYIAFWHLECFYFFGLLVFAAIRSSREGHLAYSQQVKYMVLAFNIGYLGGASNWPVWFGIHLPPYLNSLISVYVAIIAYAIVKHRLMDIQVIIKKTLVYSIITTSLTVVYLGVVTVCAQGLQGLVGFPREFSAGIAAAVVALLFHPWRNKVQVFVDRKFFRDNVNPNEKLDQLSSRIVQKTSPSELAETLFSVLEDALHPSTMALYLRSPEGSGFMRFSPDGRLALPNRMSINNTWADYFMSDSLPGPALSAEMKRAGLAGAFPLRNDSTLLGFLFMGEKKSEDRFREHDLLLIRIAVNEAAMAYEHILYYANAAQRSQPGILNEVASGFVHEIKTPLANISFPAQVIFSDLADVEQGRRKLEDLLPKLKQRMKFIMTQAVKASDRIDAIRQFAAVEDVRLEPVELADVIQDSLSTLDPLLSQAEIHVKTEVPKGMAFVRGNAKQLEIVFANLIKNAAEAMASGRPDPIERHLRIRIYTEGPMQKVDVTDSGPGIKPEDRSHMFEHHFTTKGSAGTGVGLYLIRQLVGAHGGTIDFTSEENIGTTFTVQLPSFNPQDHPAFKK